MPDVTFESFAGGEIAPAYYGRTDQDGYFVSAKKLLNYIASQTGPAIGRGGTVYAATTKAGGTVLLIPFQFNELQAYVAEFGDHYVRIYRNRALQFEDALTIDDISQADPAIVTVDHNLTDGRTIYVSGVGGMTEITDGFYLVQHVLGSGINITDLDRSFPVKVTLDGGHGLVGGEDVFLENAGGMIEVNDRTFRLLPIELQILAITGVTKANPAVVTVSGSHGLQDGDAVFIENAGGMTELNGNRYVISPKYSAAVNISDITEANPGVVTTATNHGFSHGDTVLIESVSGMTEVNDLEFTIARSLQANKTIIGMQGFGSAPVNLSVQAHGYSTGDRVYIAAIGYAVELLGREFTITVPNVDTIILDGTDISTVSKGPGFFGFYDESGTVNRVDKNKFSLGVDASGFSNYSSGGTAKRNEPNQFELDSTDSTGFGTFTEGGTATEVEVNSFYLRNENGLKHTAYTSGGTVKVVDKTQFALQDLDGNDIDSQGFSAFTSGGTIEAIHEVASPYAAADLFDSDGLPKIQFAQSNDFLFLAHPDYPPQQLTRSGHADWALSEFINEEGPFLDENLGDTTIYATAPNGTGIGAVVTLKASAPLWSAAHIGAMWQLRLRDGATAAQWVTGTAFALGDEVINGNLFYRCTSAGTSGTEAPTHDIGEAYDGADTGTNCKWKYIHNGRGIVIITGRMSSTEVTATIITELPTGVVGLANATGRWNEGAWSEAQGYPRAVAIHEGRLTWGGTAEEPLALDFSNTESPFYFNPIETDGTVVRSSAFRRVLDSNNPIRWMKSTEKGLVIGTLSGEWIVSTEGVSQGFGPDTAVARQFSENGAAAIQPIRNGDSILYAHRARKRMRDITFSIDQQKLVTSDRNLKADHIALQGITAMTYAEEPHRVTWCLLGNGKLAGLTYNREPAAQVSAWHGHGLAGSFGAGDAVVESITSIPSPTADTDDLWLAVKRTVNGQTVRYVEWMEKPLENEEDIEDGIFLDSCLSYDNPIAISAITKADPAVFTTATHSFENGDEVRVVDVEGMTEVNGLYAYVAAKTATTFSLLDEAVVASITDITQASTAVVTTAAAHGLSNGAKIGILGVAGMTEVNGLIFTVANVTATTFELSGVDSQGYGAYSAGGAVHDAIDSSVYTTYASGGEAAKTVTTIIGLDHLEGEDVGVLADGVYLTKTVASGSITLDDGAAVVRVGLYATRVLETVDLESRPGERSPNTKARTKRVRAVQVEVVGSAKGWVGTHPDYMDQMVFDEFYDGDGAPRRITGFVEETINDDYAKRKNVRWEQREAYPSMIASLTARIEVGDE